MSENEVIPTPNVKRVIIEYEDGTTIESEKGVFIETREDEMRLHAINLGYKELSKTLLATLVNVFPEAVNPDIFADPEEVDNIKRHLN